MQMVNPQHPVHPVNLAHPVHPGPETTEGPSVMEGPSVNLGPEYTRCDRSGTRHAEEPRCVGGGRRTRGSSRIRGEQGGTSPPAGGRLTLRGGYDLPPVCWPVPSA